MKLKQLGERGLIQRLRKAQSYSKRVHLGPGDDAAVIKKDRRTYILLTTDMLVEGVHFYRGEKNAEGVGHKSMAVNISDIAAMGGEPKEALVSLGAPPETPVSYLERLHRGMAGLAKKHGVSIVGGDTVRARQLIINIAMLGEVRKAHLVTRSGARPGDQLWVTGKLGGNRFGNKLHIQPRLDLARQLVRTVRPHAMMDISDGLQTDAENLCLASGVLGRIDLEKIPVHPRARQEAKACKKDPRKWALAGGEEFELLFALPKKDAARLQRLSVRNPNIRFYLVGSVTPGNAGIKVYENNRRISIQKNGTWKHF